MKRPVVVIVATAILCSCQAQKDASAGNKSQTAPNYKPLVGYDGFNFGQSFEDVLAKVNVEYISPLGLKECLDEVALRGCSIDEQRDKPALDRHEGIPYRRGFSFNKHDQLTDITLQFNREGDVSPAECVDVHQRTLDWLTSSYGPFAYQTPKKKEDGVSVEKTAHGVSYLIWRGKDGSFVTPPLRNVGRSLEKRRALPIVKWDSDRYVWLISTYILVDKKPICDVTINFEEPQSVERRIQRADEKLP